MNKNKIVMCAIGGTGLVIALVLGYLTYSAWEERVEKEDSLDSMKAKVKRISSGPIAPQQASVDAIDENCKNLAIWFDKAFDVAARGDKAFPAGVSQAEFRNQLREESDEKRKLPGAADGRLVAEDFDFGFKDILFEGKIPAAADIPVLQRQWDDIKLFVDTLAECGALQILRIEKEAPKAKEDEAAAEAQRQKNHRNRSGRNNRRGAQADEEENQLADAKTYTVEFLARPPAFIRAVNAFAKTERFVVAELVSFERKEDALDAILGGKEKDEPQAAPHRRRRAAQEQQEAAAQEQQEAAAAQGAKKKGVVTDPVTEKPFTVTLKLVTYDFGTKGAGAAAAAEGEEAK